jgi:hypothetical protein
MGALHLERSVPAGFPTNMPVTVTGGQYNGDHGVVVDQPPDLRPGSVWVRLVRAGVHLVPGYRLVPMAAKGVT